MLELQKLTELETPTKLDKFKKSIKTINNKEVPTLDFFKTFRARNKKTALGKIIERSIMAFLFIFSALLLCSDIAEQQHRDVVAEQQHENYNLAQKIVSELDNKNTFNINLFNELKKSPTAYGDHLSGAIVQRLLVNNKISPKVKDKVLKSYMQNWNSGIKKEEEFYKNCSSFGCSEYADNAENARNRILPYLEKTLSFAKHPDMFEKYIELEKLKQKYSVVIN